MDSTRQGFAIRCIAFSYAFSAALILSGCGTQASFRNPWNVEPMAAIPPPEPAPPVIPETAMEAPMVSSPPPQLPQTVVVKRKTVPKKRPARVRRAPASVAPAELVGFEFGAVLDVLRKPDSIRKDVLPIVWTYSYAGCTLRLFFYPEIESEKFRVLKFDLRDRSGQKLSNTAECMQKFMVAKNVAKNNEANAE